MPQQGQYMATPSPFSSASAEARRRYEERYAKKRAEEAAKAAGEAAPQPPAQQQQAPAPQQQHYQPPPQQHQQQPPQQGYGGPPHPHQGYQNNGAPPPRQQYSSPPQQHQQYDQRQQPPPQQHQPPQHYQQQPQQYQQQPSQQSPQQHYQQQQQPQSRPQSFQSPPPAQPGMYHSPPTHHDQRSPPPPQQRWSQQSGQGQGLGLGGGQGQQWQQGGQVHQQHQQQAQAQGQMRNQPQSPPPPTGGVDDRELENMFTQFDSSRSGQLSPFDLQRLLAKDATMDAREDCVKMLMNIFDTDRSGSINYMEFEGLYRYIQDWHGIFRRFDRDNSGLIDRKELHNALLGFGFSLPADMVARLVSRFTPPPVPGQQAQQGISFDRFLMACVTVKHYTEAFRRIDVQGTGHITVGYNEFMDIVLDAPS
ncbi:hypothetical protein IAT38_004385 [Cryptococcus sp. DSM 104549]